MKADTIRYRERAAKGLCPICGARPTVSGKKACDPCLAKRRVSGRETYHEMRSLGLCVRCGADAIPGKTLCPVHLAKENTRVRATYRRTKGTGQRADSQ